MNEIELARQQLLAIRLDEIMLATALLAASTTAAAVACAFAVQAIAANKAKDKDAVYDLSLVVWVAFLVFVLLFGAGLASINRVVDTYVSPNTIVPGYVPEK